MSASPPFHFAANRFSPSVERPLFSDTERRVLDALRREQSASRAALARLTGLAKPSVSRIVEDLVARGFIGTGERRVNGRGQPSLDVHLIADAAWCFGVSLMTDAFAVTLTDMSGQVHAQVLEAFPVMTREGLMERLARLLAELADRHVGDRGKVFGLGLGVTGFFVDDAPRVNPPLPLEAFALIDLQALFEQHLGLRVSVENDGSAAAVGEMLNGTGSWTSNFAYLYFSAGFGGGVILNGQLWRGIKGNAGEFAGILPPDRYAQPNLERLRASVAEQGLTFEGLGPFLAAFDIDWPGVEAWIDDVASSLTLVCSAIRGTLDVEAIVFGGRIPPALSRRLIDRIDWYQVPRRGYLAPAPRLVCAASQGDATSAGAAALLLRQHFF